MLCNLIGERLKTHNWRGALDLVFRFRQKSASSRPSGTAQFRLDRFAQVLEEVEPIGDGALLAARPLELTERTSRNDHG